MTLDPRLRRLDRTRLRVENRHGLDAVLFANDQVPVESAAVTELLDLLELQETVEQVARTAPDQFEEAPAVERVAVTPDFHKARGVPVGTVLATRGFLVPQAIGNDINCGMRLHTTTLRAEEVTSRLDELEMVFRHLFFEGGRNIIRSRRDIVNRKLEEIKQEAPYAYKEIGPIIETLTEAGIARPVAEVRPLMTMKG